MKNQFLGRSRLGSVRLRLGFSGQPGPALEHVSPSALVFWYVVVYKEEILSEKKNLKRKESRPCAQTMCIYALISVIIHGLILVTMMFLHTKLLKCHNVPTKHYSSPFSIVGKQHQHHVHSLSDSSFFFTHDAPFFLSDSLSASCSSRSREKIVGAFSPVRCTAPTHPPPSVSVWTFSFLVLG